MLKYDCQVIFFLQRSLEIFLFYFELSYISSDECLKLSSCTLYVKMMQWVDNNGKNPINSCQSNLIYQKSQREGEKDEVLFPPLLHKILTENKIKTNKQPAL